MPIRTELARRLKETERLIEWAILRVPSERLLEAPPHSAHPQSEKGFKTYFGEWPALRQLFHLAFYEATYAVPAMQHFLGGPHPSTDLVFPEPEPEETAWRDALAQGVGVAALLQRLHELRGIQLNQLRNLPGQTWHAESLETGLGPVSAEFVVAKTIQHRLEHANDLLKNALYWDRALEWLDEQAHSE